MGLDVAILYIFNAEVGIDDMGARVIELFDGRYASQSLMAELAI